MKLTYAKGMGKQDKKVVCIGCQELRWQNNYDPHAPLNYQSHNAVWLKLEATNEVSVFQAQLKCR